MMIEKALITVAIRICTALVVWAGTASAVEPAETPNPSAMTVVMEAEYARLIAIARQNQAAAKRHAGTLDITGRPTLGSTNAALALVEFGSFQCPYCRRHHTGVMQSLKTRYIESGKLLYVFYDIALDPGQAYAQRAAEAAHCADEQDRYWEFRDRLYRNQKALAPDFLDSHAAASSLDLQQFRLCLASGRYRAQTQRDQALVRRMGIRGTPTFFVGHVNKGSSKVTLVRRFSGARSFQIFAEQIDSLGTTTARVGVKQPESIFSVASGAGENPSLQPPVLPSEGVKK